MSRRDARRPGENAALVSRSRLRNIRGFSIDEVARAAGGDPDVPRLENLDTDLRPPSASVAATRLALERRTSNSYLPFTGSDALRIAAAAHAGRLAGQPCDPDR